MCAPTKAAADAGVSDVRARCRRRVGADAGADGGADERRDAGNKASAAADATATAAGEARPRLVNRATEVEEERRDETRSLAVREVHEGGSVPEARVAVA